MNTLEIASEPADPHLGTTLRERYRLDALLGSGAMGAVYRAWDLEREISCAVKLLRVESRMRKAASLRFVDEARIVAEIFHPHIVEVFDHGADADGALFLVMELLEGQDLDAFLKTEKRLSIAQTLEIVGQIGSALHSVHQVGVVHRDIKPRNIFLVRSPQSTERFQVKVIDFGLAKYLDASPRDRGSDGLLIGTPEYLAPEAWSGVSTDVDTRVDQWALAVLTYRLLSGCMPFENHLDTLLLGKEIVETAPRKLRELVPSLPVHIERALYRALSKDKRDRFPSIREFVRALSRLPPRAAAPVGCSTVLCSHVQPCETRVIAMTPGPTVVQPIAPTVHQAVPATFGTATQLLRLAQTMPREPSAIADVPAEKSLRPHWLRSGTKLFAAAVLGGLLAHGLSLLGPGVAHSGSQREARSPVHEVAGIAPATVLPLPSEVSPPSEVAKVGSAAPPSCPEKLSHVRTANDKPLRRPTSRGPRKGRGMGDLATARSMTGASGTE